MGAWRATVVIATILVAGVLGVLSTPWAASAAAVVVPDPVLSIGFGEGSGPTADDAAPGDHDATLDGATWVAGQSGSGLHFDGDGDQVDIVGDGLHRQAGTTISLWVRSSGNDPAAGAVILEAGTAGCDAASFGLYATDDGVEARTRVGGPFSGDVAWDTSYYGGIDVWDGSWHNVTIAKSWIVVDGFQLGGAGGFFDFDEETNDDIVLGASLAGAGCDQPSFRGDIDDLRIWSTGLEREQVGSLLPAVIPTVTIDQPEPVQPRFYGECVLVTVTPLPPGGVTRVEVRDDEDTLVGSSYNGACWGWPEQPQGTYAVPVMVTWAGDFHATAFFEPGLPWTAAESDTVELHVPRREVTTQLFVPNVMPGTTIVGDAVVRFGEADDRGGSVQLVDVTGGGETVVATVPVTVLPSSTDGSAHFELPGRVAGDYEFEARYSGTPDLFAPGASEPVTVDVDDTLGDRGPVTFGVSPTYWTGDVLDVYAPADAAQYVEVREPGGQWSRQGYNLPVIYPLDTFADTPADGPITIQVRWEDDGGRFSEIQEAMLTLDRTNPTVQAAGSPVYKTTTGGTVPVRVGWKAGDKTSGVATSEVQVSTNGGAYRTVTGATPASSVDQRLMSGKTFRYRIRTVDVAGNVSGWAYDRTLRPTMYSEGSSIIRYSGSWATLAPSLALGDRVKSTTSAGARASVTFTGRSFGWVATTGPTRGKAGIYVNGSRVATVDLYSPTTRYGQVVYAKTWTTSASRRVEIRNLGTVGRPRIDIDAILLVR